MHLNASRSHTLHARTRTLCTHTSHKNTHHVYMQILTRIHIIHKNIIITHDTQTRTRTRTPTISLSVSKKVFIIMKFQRLKQQLLARINSLPIGLPAILGIATSVLGIAVGLATLAYWLNSDCKNVYNEANEFLIIYYYFTGLQNICYRKQHFLLVQNLKFRFVFCSRHEIIHSVFAL